MRKGVIVGLILGLAIPPAFAALNVGFVLENDLFRDVCAMSAMSALIIKYGKNAELPLDSYAIADKMVMQRRKK